MTRYSKFTTVTEVFEAMERGEKLRWVPKDVVGRLRDGDVYSRELCIGNKIILNDDLAICILNHSRVKEVPSTEDDPYTDYELL